MFKIGRDYTYRGFIIYYNKNGLYTCHVKSIDDNGKAYEKTLTADSVMSMISEIDAFC